MSVFIKGMEMPENCSRCDFIKLNAAVRCFLFTGINGRAKDCPLVEISIPHGRLIDERVAEQCIGDHMTGIAGREGRSDWQRVHDGLADAPTVIETEREEHDE